MNAFLTKPVDLAHLHETLDRFGLGTLSPLLAAARDAGRDSNAPINLARLNELTADDAEFAYELAVTFFASGEQVLHEIDVAIAAFDRTALSRAAHKLKGASANIHADPLCALALRLETQASQLDQPRLKELIEELRGEFVRAADFLTAQAPEPKAKAG
jgi:HPt (histidine-containing phosphotransfer) domain-containing protein